MSFFSFFPSLCLSTSKAFSSSTSTIVWLPLPPRAGEHPHPCCITEEQKRECQTPPSRSLSRPSPHPASRWGCLFFQGLSEPQESSKMDVPLPLSPLFSCPSSTCSLCHAPVPRARPLPQPTLTASSIQSFNHLLAMALLQDITFAAVNLLFRICAPPRPAEGKSYLHIMTVKTVCDEAALLDWFYIREQNLHWISSDDPMQYQNIALK